MHFVAFLSALSVTIVLITVVCCPIVGCGMSVVSAGSVVSLQFTLLYVSVVTISMLVWLDSCLAPDRALSPVSIQTLALRALRKRKPQETQEVGKQPIVVATASTEHSYWLALAFVA